MVVISLNHLEILAIHETSCKCVWLKFMIKHIRGSCELSSIKDTLIVLHEDNVACIAQIKGGCIKGDQINENSFFFFFFFYQKSK